MSVSRSRLFVCVSFRMPRAVTDLLIEAAWNFVLVVKDVCWLALL